jgi:hypothetical protein
MSMSAKERNIIIGAVVAIIIVGLLAFLLGRGCEDKNATTTAAGTGTSTVRTATEPVKTVEPPPTETVETVVTPPAPAPEPTPAPATVSFELNEAASGISWDCEPNMSTMSGTCYAGSQLHLDVSARVAASVTATITGPGPSQTVSLGDYGPHEGGFDPADYDIIFHDWGTVTTAPPAVGTYTIVFTATGRDGSTKTLTSDSMGNPFVFTVVP